MDDLEKGAPPIVEENDIPESVYTAKSDKDNPEHEAAAAKLWAVYVSEVEKYDRSLVESVVAAKADLNQKTSRVEVEWLWLRPESNGRFPTPARPTLVRNPECYQWEDVDQSPKVALTANVPDEIRIGGIDRDC
ncbi:hypothetical protein DFH06DRAFT_1125140 [Mycena polygramma]|nr:hypothetical protein DFH06DRAFT_1125140 [Mycena polygramma]